MRAATRAPLRVNAASKPYDVPLNLTTWCLEQERLGIIDNELAVVITSIASSCKRVRLAPLYSAERAAYTPNRTHLASRCLREAPGRIDLMYSQPNAGLTLREFERGLKARGSL